MALTLTSTAYSATPKVLHAGLNSVSFDYTSAASVTFCSSANATVILGPKIAQNMTITNIYGSHSCGAATCPVDIGIESSLSKFSSQKAQSVHAMAAATGFPYKVSVSDDAAAMYKVVKFAFTPGTNTAVVNAKYTVEFTRDP